MTTSIHQQAAVLLLGACLAACSRTDDAAPRQATAPAAAPTIAVAAAPTAAAQENQGKHAWMRAVFGQAYDAGTGRAVVKGGPDAADYYAMTLEAEQVLPDGRVALVVNGMESDEHGNTDEMMGAGVPGILNVYLLRPGDGGWVVAERHDQLEALGQRGAIGTVAWVSLGVGKPGFSVDSYYFSRGQAVTNIVVYGLEQGVRQLAELRVSNDISGACRTDHEVCWDIEGAVRFDPPAAADGYADIVVDFRGKRFRVTEGENGEQVEHLIEPVQQTARYRFDGKTYALASGANPADDS